MEILSHIQKSLSSRRLVLRLPQYLYYIAICEPLADAEIIKFCYEYISYNQDYFKYMIKSCKLNEISTNDIDLSYELMKNWEMPKINGNILISNAVVNDFWIFSSLVNRSLGYSLVDALGKIIIDNEFKLYSQYFADDNRSDLTSHKYKDFCNLFGFNFDNTAITSLKYFLSEAYKQRSIQEAKYEHASLKNDTEFLSKQKHIVEKYCNQLSNHFSNKSQKVISDPITLFNSIEFCSDLLQNENQLLQDMIRSKILTAVCEKILPNIMKEKVEVGSPIIPIIKELSEKYSCNSVDTVIGGRIYFPFSESDQRKHIIEKFGDKFLSKYITDKLFFISKKNFYINFSNIEVNLQEISRKEILKEVAPNDDGIFSIVISNKLIGYFTEDEL